jgi:GDP-L-fucose synthase
MSSRKRNLVEERSRHSVKMDKRAKIFLTGANGMVGKNIIADPYAQNYIFLTPSSSELDLRNYQYVEDFIKLHKPDFIVHCAGVVGGIQANINSPLKFLVDNMDIGRNVILGARQCNIKKLINLASSCIYPKDVNGLLSEEMILTGALEPTNEGYAFAKIYAIKLCEYIRAENAKFEYKTLIPCNLYGKHDKFDPEKSHLLPSIIKKIHEAKLQNYQHVEIWGDGSARREFMYAADLSEAIFKCLSNIDATPNIMNIGIGTDHTIQEYYEACARIIGWHGNFTYNLDKPTGMIKKQVSIEKQSAWGWKPATNLDSGIQKTYEFFLGLKND